MLVPCFWAMPWSAPSRRWNHSQPPAWLITLEYLLLLYVSARTLRAGAAGVQGCSTGLWCSYVILLIRIIPAPLRDLSSFNLSLTYVQET